MGEENNKWFYITPNGIVFTPDGFDLQIVLGLQTCKTKKDVMDLLKDVRHHERIQCKRLK